MLYPYQIDGANFLSAHRRAILADEMGLGKTRQAIFAAKQIQSKKVLVVCPSSIKMVWENEIKTVLGDDVTIAVVKDGKKEYNGDWQIVSYDLVKAIKAMDYDVIIADEAHYLKNTRTQRTRSFLNLVKNNKRAYVWLLSGTLVPNRPTELVGPLCAIGHLYNRASVIGFLNRYSIPLSTPWGIKYDGVRNLPELREKLKKIWIRREKKDILSLPEKTRHRLYLPLSPQVAKEYKKVYHDFALWAMENQREIQSMSPIAMMRLTTLRQLSAVGKVEAIIEWIQNFLEEKEKLVVFGYHREPMKYLIDAFPDAVTIRGDDDLDSRRASVEAFQRGSARIVLASLRAAAEGVTLTAAADALFVEGDWSPAKNLQAEDRLHRIGQMNRVSYYYTIGTIDGMRTVDEYIYALAAGKSETIYQLMGGELWKA